MPTRPEPQEVVAPLPEAFNLCSYFLDRNLEEGRADKVAVICGDERRTYGQIAARTRRLTAALRDLGLRAEERVLIVLPDGIEFVETWFATLRAGGVFAMVNPLQKSESLAYTIEYVKPRIVVAHASVLAEIGAVAEASRFAEHLVVVGGEHGEALAYEQLLEA
ncbi:MAG: 4-hydroxybenzoate-CoA ligase, partial [Chlamydiales bacterium]